MKQNLLDIARETKTPFLDVRQILQAKEDPHELVGHDWYVDHVHPSIRGHQLIAESIVEKLVDADIIGSLAEWSIGDRHATYKKQMDSLGDHYLQQGRRRVEWLENWGRRDRLQDDTIPIDNRSMLDYGLLALAFGEYDTADSLLEVVPKTEYKSRVLDRALRLFRSGQTKAAKTLVSSLSAATQRKPGSRRSARGLVGHRS